MAVSEIEFKGYLSNMYTHNWIRKSLSLLLVLITLASVLPQATLAESYSAIVAVAEARVYQKASMSGVFAVVPKGTVMTVKGVKNGIAQVSRGGYIGYVSIDDLGPDTSDEATDINQTVTLVSPLTVYAKASTSAKKTVTPAGEEIQVIAEGTGGWLKLMRGKYTAYALKDDLEQALQATAAPTVTPEPTATPAPTMEPVEVVVSKKATVYSVAGKKLGTVYVGEELLVIDVSGEWAQIDKNGKKGFVSKDCLTKIADVTPEPTATPAPTMEPVQVIVNKNSTVYSTAGKKLGTVYVGEELTVIDVSGDWALIDKNGNKGLVAKSSLTKAAEVTPEPTATPAPTVEVKDPIACVVTANTVVVYEKASTSSTVLGKLKKNETVDVVNVLGNWALISKDGHLGYALKGGLTPAAEVNPSVPEVKFTATVISDSMVIYQTASTKATKIATVTLGTTVNVHEGGSSWAMVSVDGNVGYAQIACMSARSYDTYASGDSSTGVKAFNELLLKKGYYDLVPGNDYGTETVAAVKRLQAALGLEQTGKADITLMRLLNEATVPVSPLMTAGLAKGSKGADVTRLQTRLNALGYLAKSSSVDADFGATTQSAVKLFQKTAGVTQSGTADAATMKAMYAVGAPKLPSGTDPADQASAETDPGSSDNSPLSASGQEKVETVIAYATSKLGCKYVFGSSGPTTFDCSGLTMASFKQVGIKLPHSAYSTAYGAAGTKISYSGLVRGDVICMNTNANDSDLSDHVGIYLGSGKMIHASSGQAKVVISDITSGYYYRVFSWAKRFIN